MNRNNERNESKRKQYLEEYMKIYRANHREVKVTFNTLDYDVIKKIASKQGLRLASFIRQATHAQARYLYLFPQDLEEEIKAAVRNMRGIGNNINQVARYVNTEQYSSIADMEVIFNFLKKMEDEVKSIKQIVIKKRVRKVDNE